jgi:hypothetical protein
MQTILWPVKYGGPLTERQPLMSPTDLAQALRKNADARSAYAGSPDIRRDNLEQNADHYEQHVTEINTSIRTEY